jgi:hypothetical protein
MRQQRIYQPGLARLQRPRFGAAVGTQGAVLVHPARE